MNRRIGIIDIGSNSIRLVIYETTPKHGYRVIDESKETARLSERIDDKGVLHDPDIQFVADILNRFIMLCESHEVGDIVAVATAAIRNASNNNHIMTKLKQTTSLDIRLLSGSEEAEYGFIGMINTINRKRGFVIDIGGGSTEISWFDGRRLKISISLPYGAVNTMKRHIKHGVCDEQARQAIEASIRDAVEDCPWIREHAGEALIGMGGTIRSVCKIIQKQQNYSFPQAHQFTITPDEIGKLLNALSAMSIQERKHVDGLSKDRADTIVPGMIILKTLIDLMQVKQLIVSGSGLRDGLYFSAVMPDKPVVEDVLEASLHNMLLLHAHASQPHVRQVNRFALQLFDTLKDRYGIEGHEWRTSLHVASLLYRIGVTVNYYNFDQHTFYMVAHSRLNGLTHREVLLSALIASYKNKNRTKQLLRQHKDILHAGDLKTVVMLGELLQLAIALDRSETQPISALSLQMRKTALDITAATSHACSVESRAAELVSKDFHKVWGIHYTLRIMFP